MKPIRWRTPGKDVALTSIDEAAFSVLLRDAFPGIVFVGSRSFRELGDVDGDLTGSWIDAHGFESVHIADGAVVAIIPSCRWRPMPLVIDGHTYNLKGPFLRFQYRRGLWDWRTYHGAKLAYDPPTLEFGNITTSYLTDEPLAQAFYASVLKLLRKVTTDWVRSELPHTGYVMGEGRADYWVGHDAYRWCSESPTRMIGGIARPTLDWQFPDVPWYRAVEGVDRGVQRPDEGHAD